MSEKIMVVLIEPNDQLRFMIRNALEQAGFRIVNEASSVEEATCHSFLRQLKAQQPRVAVIAQHFDGGDDGGTEVARIFDKAGLGSTYISLSKPEDIPLLWSRIDVPRRTDFQETVQELLSRLAAEDRLLQQSIKRDHDVPTSAVSPALLATFNEKEEGLWRTENTDTGDEALTVFEDREFLSSY